MRFTLSHLFLMLVGMAFSQSLCGQAATGRSEWDAAAVRMLMEKVADWQLSHPVGFDFRWQRPGFDRATADTMRIDWDGVVLRRRLRPASDTPKPDVPEPWQQLLRLLRNDLAFAELPSAVQESWCRETGLPPEGATHIHMMDGAARGWEMGTFYHGLLAVGRVSHKPVYRAALRAIGGASHWQLGARIYHADDHCVGYAWLDAFAADRSPLIISNVQARFDWILKHPAEGGEWEQQGQDRWTWCDALFMAPPVWARLAALTGDRSYLDFMDREWWTTTARLYAPEERLFYRDPGFLERREPNGRPVFWSRGNGWVLAALTLVLEHLPDDYPSRQQYQALFREMAGRIAALQPDDGLWRSSLLDPTSFPEPESSGSAFFCYGLAWGINHRLLEPAAYLPYVERAWIGLTRCVQPDGRLGYVQQPGAAPGSAPKLATAPYGVGAFLLAGEQVLRLGQRTGPR